MNRLKKTYDRGQHNVLVKAKDGWIKLDYFPEGLLSNNIKLAHKKTNKLHRMGLKR